MMNSHPILKQNGFIMPAPPLVEFIQEFSRLHQNGELSMIFYGKHRYGKSTARRYLLAALAARKRMVVLSASIGRDIKQTDKRDRIWRDFLRGQNPDEPVISNRPYDVVLKKVQVEADALGTDDIVVIIDEAQNLSLERLGDLKKFIDDLIDLGLSPFVLLIAQPEILQRPERLKRFHKEDLVDRFFTEVHRFRGLKPTEIEDVLAFYDEEQWGGKTYTEYFVPDLWNEGWRLKSQAGQFRHEFAELNRSLSTGTDEIGMKYLVAAVRGFFNDIRNKKPELDEQAATIRACVAGSGLVTAWKVVGNSERHAAETLGKSRRRMREADA
jgi:type II secretory pathway predicted ATPase ExeA